MNKSVWLLFCLSVSPCFAQPSETLLDAIEQVESSGKGSNTPDGDNGKAIGPFQIHYVYWKDAVEYDKSLANGTYQKCRDPFYARKVARAYLTRYGKGKTDLQMARIHNGGPQGHKKTATQDYSQKVQVVLKSK
jgi:hypothetical protein